MRWGLVIAIAAIIASAPANALPGSVALERSVRAIETAATIGIDASALRLSGRDAPAPTFGSRICSRPRVAIRIGCLAGVARIGAVDVPAGRSVAMAMFGGLSLALVFLVSASGFVAFFDPRSTSAPRPRME